MPHVAMIYPTSAHDLAEAIDFALSKERYQLEHMALEQVARLNGVRDNIVMADWLVVLLPPASTADPDTCRQLDRLPVVPNDTLVLHWRNSIQDCLPGAHWIDMRTPIRNILNQVRLLATKRQRQPHPALLVIWAAANILHLQ